MKKLTHVIMILVGIDFLNYWTGEEFTITFWQGMICIIAAIFGLTGKRKGRSISIILYLIVAILFFYNMITENTLGASILLTLIPIVVTISQKFGLAGEKGDKDFEDPRAIQVSEKSKDSIDNSYNLEERLSNIEGFALKSNEKLAQEDSKEKWEKEKFKFYG